MWPDNYTTGQFRMNFDKKQFRLSLHFWHEMAPLPKPLAYHCAVYVKADDALFIHGGIENYTDVISSTKSFLYDFKSNFWSSVEDKFPCPPSPSHIRARCSLWGTNEAIVVPSHSLKGEPCTAIFEWKQKKWTKLSTDSRARNVQHAHLVQAANGTRLFIIGGNDIHTMEYVNSVYEFHGLVKGWEKTSGKLPFNVGTNMTFVAMPAINDFFET